MDLITLALAKKYTDSQRLYYTEGGMVEIPVMGKWVDDNGDGVNEVFYMTSPLALEVGKSYTVKWGDKEYVCDGMDAYSSLGVPGGVYLGSIAVMDDRDEGIPFIILSSPAQPLANGVYGVATGIEKTEVEFAIYAYETIIHKLDNKYLDMDWIPKLDGSVLIPEQTVFVDNSGVGPTAAWDVIYKSGKEVVVVMDGQYYSGRMSEDADCTGIVALDSSEPNGSNYFDDSHKIGGKFTLQWIDGAKLYSLHHDDPGVHTFTVYEANTNKLPEVLLPANVPNIQTAEVGQTMVVKAVDADGKPIDWEPCTMPAIPVVELTTVADPAVGQVDLPDVESAALNDAVSKSPVFILRAAIVIDGSEFSMCGVTTQIPGDEYIIQVVAEGVVVSIAVSKFGTAWQIVGLIESTNQTAAAD